ncbi:hypothetical protein D3C81_1368840 [compost metagenome]
MFQDWQRAFWLGSAQWTGISEGRKKTNAGTRRWGCGMPCGRTSRAARRLRISGIKKVLITPKSGMALGMPVTRKSSRLMSGKQSRLKLGQMRLNAGLLPARPANSRSISGRLSSGTSSYSNRKTCQSSNLVGKRFQKERIPGSSFGLSCGTNGPAHSIRSGTSSRNMQRPARPLSPMLATWCARLRMASWILQPLKGMHSSMIRSSSKLRVLSIGTKYPKGLGISTRRAGRQSLASN